MHHLALTEFSAAEPRAALAALLRSDALLAEFGERSFRSTSQALLAKAHELLGDADSARAAIALADELGAPEDIINYAITHAVRARLALADGDGRGAERWARSAVEYAWQTDFAGTRAEAKLELARILFGLDRSEEAAAEAREAQAIFEGKGDRAGAGEAQELLDQIGA